MTFVQACWMRKKYVPLYIKALQSHQMGGDEETQKMDEALPEATILLFRRLAHAQVRSLQVTAMHPNRARGVPDLHRTLVIHRCRMLSKP